MLTLINLYTLDKIFNEFAQHPVGMQARALYVNCITHHFKERTKTVANAVMFELFKTDIKNYKVHEKIFFQLQKSELVEIGTESVVFLCAWGQYIDREQLEKIAPDEFVAGFHFHPVSKFVDDLYSSQSLVELCAMKYKLSASQVKKMIELFLKEQETFEKKYSDHADCKKHFTYWLKTNADKVPKETVRSTGKILGES